MLDPEDESIELEDAEVDPDYRNRGILKEMLRHSVVVARELGVSAISGAIVSREALDAVRAVFGEEHVTVTREGEYGELPDYDTDDDDRYASAYLDVPLDRIKGET